MNGFGLKSPARCAILLMTIVVSLCGTASSQSGKPHLDVKPDVVSHAVMKMEFPSLKKRKPIQLKAEKIIVLGLWASWCGPCRLAVLRLNGVSRDFAHQGVTVVALTPEDRNQSEAPVRNFARRAKIRYPMGWVKSNTAEILMNGKHTIPQILLVSTDGIVLKRFLGWNDLVTETCLREAITEELQKLGSIVEAKRN